MPSIRSPTQRDADAVVRQTVEIIHRAVDGIDDPLPLALLISRDAFLAKNRVVGKLVEQVARDEFLGLDVERELDVMRVEFVHFRRTPKFFPEHRAGISGSGDCGFEGGIQIVHALAGSVMREGIVAGKRNLGCIGP